MNKSNFILLNITDKHGLLVPTYVNIHHILKIWERDNKIIVELTDYMELEICNENINTLMDRFY
jgi:acyl-CoA hydrolase